MLEGMREPLYLEDLKVGQRFKTGTHPLTEDEIIAFARQYDPQPFHTDPEAARQTFFQGLAASGWQTGAITMRLQVEYGPPLAGGMIGASLELSWPQATRPGDVLHVESEILDVTPSRSKPDRGFITLKSLTKNQKDEVVQSQTARLLVWRRKSP
jgi:acyl dehydratase